MIDLSYVTGAPFFWLSMGMTAAIGVFMGALIYNGDLTMFKKGLVTILSYAFLLTITNVARITDGRSLEVLLRHPNSTAATITIVFITIFYVLGMAIGVSALNHTKKK